MNYLIDYPLLVPGRTIEEVTEIPAEYTPCFTGPTMAKAAALRGFNAKLAPLPPLNEEDTLYIFSLKGRLLVSGECQGCEQHLYKL
jgi:hypothetical protein